MAPSMTRDALILAATALATLLSDGCAYPSGRPRGLRSATSQPTATQPTGKDQGKYHLIVQFRLLSIEAPAGSFSKSEELWKHVDEESVQAGRSGLLARNGLRVGLASAKAWDDLEGVFKRLSGRAVGQASATTLPGRPAAIPVKRHQPPQTIFVFYPDGSLSGADYPPGDDLLAVNCTLSQSDPSLVYLTVLPQVRSSEVRTTIVNRPEGPGYESLQELFSFDALQFQVEIRSQDILLIGPSADVRRGDSLAARFLVAEKAGMRYETVLVVIPQVVAAPINE